MDAGLTRKEGKWQNASLFLAQLSCCLAIFVPIYSAGLKAIVWALSFFVRDPVSPKPLTRETICGQKARLMCLDPGLSGGNVKPPVDAFQKFILPEILLKLQLQTGASQRIPYRKFTDEGITATNWRLPGIDFVVMLSTLVIEVLSGPVLRDTARLSQRYPPIARYGVLGVSTWPIGCDTPSPFSE